MVACGIARTKKTLINFFNTLTAKCMLYLARPLRKRALTFPTTLSCNTPSFLVLTIMKKTYSLLFIQGKIPKHFLSSHQIDKAGTQIFVQFFLSEGVPVYPPNFPSFVIDYSIWYNSHLWRKVSHFVSYYQTDMANREATVSRRALTCSSI